MTILFDLLSKTYSIISPSFINENLVGIILLSFFETLEALETGEPALSNQLVYDWLDEI